MQPARLLPGVARQPHDGAGAPRTRLATEIDHQLGGRGGAGRTRPLVARIACGQRITVFARGVVEGVAAPLDGIAGVRCAVVEVLTAHRRTVDAGPLFTRPDVRTDGAVVAGGRDVLIQASQAVRARPRCGRADILGTNVTVVTNAGQGAERAAFFRVTQVLGARSAVVAAGLGDDARATRALLAGRAGAGIRAIRGVRRLLAAGLWVANVGRTHVAVVAAALPLGLAHAAHAAGVARAHRPIAARGAVGEVRDGALAKGRHAHVLAARQVTRGRTRHDRRRVEAAAAGRGVAEQAAVAGVAIVDLDAVGLRRARTQRHPTTALAFAADRSTADLVDGALIRVVAQRARLGGTERALTGVRLARAHLAGPHTFAQALDHGARIEPAPAAYLVAIKTSIAVVCVIKRQTFLIGCAAADGRAATAHPDLAALALVAHVAVVALGALVLLGHQAVTGRRHARVDAAGCVFKVAACHHAGWVRRALAERFVAVGHPVAEVAVVLAGAVSVRLAGAYAGSGHTHARLTMIGCGAHVAVITGRLVGGGKNRANAGFWRAEVLLARGVTVDRALDHGGEVQLAGVRLFGEVAVQRAVAEVAVILSDAVVLALARAGVGARRADAFAVARVADRAGLAVIARCPIAKFNLALPGLGLTDRLGAVGVAGGVARDDAGRVGLTHRLVAAQVADRNAVAQVAVVAAVRVLLTRAHERAGGAFSGLAAVVLGAA